MKKYFTFANLLLITGIVYIGVAGFYRIVSAKLNVAPLPSKADVKFAPEEKKRRPAAGYRAIIDRNLFKTKDEDKKETVEEPKTEDTDAPPTKLKLKLWGTVTGERRWAFIEDGKERKQLLKEEGESIQDAIIKKIEQNKVILLVKGEEEILMMEELTASAGKSTVSRRLARNPKIDIPKPGAAPSGKQKVNIKRAEIDDAVSNINEIMSQAKIRPHYKNGKPDGLTLTRVKPNSIFTRLGLRSGDILKGVDGEDIQSVDDALKLYNSLKTSEGVSLQIKRRGKERTIDYKID